MLQLTASASGSIMAMSGHTVAYGTPAIVCARVESRCPLKQLTDTITSLDTMYVGAFVEFFRRIPAAVTRSGIGGRQRPASAPSEINIVLQKSALRGAFCGSTFRVRRKTVFMENSTAPYYIA